MKAKLTHKLALCHPVPALVSASEPLVWSIGKCGPLMSVGGIVPGRWAMMWDDKLYTMSDRTVIGQKAAAAAMQRPS